MKFSWSHFAIKLTSRSFWAMVAGFVTGVLTLFQFTDSIVVQIGGLVLSLGSIVAYLLTNTNTGGDPNA